MTESLRAWRSRIGLGRDLGPKPYDQYDTPFAGVLTELMTIVGSYFPICDGMTVTVCSGEAILVCQDKPYGFSFLLDYLHP